MTPGNGRSLPLACLLFIILMIAPCVAMAAEVTLDLAGDHKITRSVAPQELRFILTNRLPKGAYTILVQTKTIPIPAFPDLTLPKSGFASAECDELTLGTENLMKAPDEKQVRFIIGQLREGISGGKCADAAVVQSATAAIGETTTVVDGTYPVSYGTSVTVVVTRGTESWEFTLDGGNRGEWIVTYGVAITPGDDQSYFAKAAGNNKFTVTPQTEIDQLKLIPTVYYTWLDRKFANRLFSPGITAGIGLKENQPAIFAGASALYNWNLQFAVGVTVSKQDRLRGQYQSAQELSENLTPEQLNQGVFRPSVGFVVSFRFGSNPFGTSEAPPKEGEQGKEKKEPSKTDSKGGTDKSK